MRKSLFVVALVVVAASLAACDKNNQPTSPTPTTTTTTTPTLPPDRCWDEKALNRGEPLPCIYPPENEVRIGLPVGFGDMRPGNFVSATPMSKPGYPGRVEVRIQINTPGSHLIRLTLGNPNGNIFIKSVTGVITGSGTVSVLFDGNTDVQPFAVNADPEGMISGKASFWYVKEE